MVVSYCLALQHLPLDLYNLTQDWIIYLPDQLDNKLIGPPKENQESLSTQIKERSVLSKQLCGFSAWCKTTCLQVNHKQGEDFTKLPWCFWWYWMLSRSPISHPDRSNHYTQADTLQTYPSASERSFPARNWQDTHSGSSEVSAWGHPMDQQFCTCWKEGQAWKFEIENLLGPHQYKQSDSEGTIPLQNTEGHCSFACRCLYYSCVWLQ